LIRLGEKGKDRIHWVTDKSRKTTIKERLYLDDELKFRLDSEDLFEISEEIEASLISKIDEVIDGFDVILLSDYAKGVLSRNLVKEIVDRAKKHELPIVTDPGFGRIEIFSGCSVIKPNQKEWAEYVGKKESEKIAIADLFSQGTGNILITQGSLGLRLITPTLDVQVRSQDSIQVVDVTGAGDSLAAGVALVLGRGFELVSQLDRLNLIGARTVSSRKTELPDVDVI
jgi:D-beta-D-heptose 7-phosphate kinase/D-beta-D-heptose 1-phosphate adenosyltransferase